MVAVVLAFVGAASYISFVILQRQAALSQVSRYNIQWSASQAVVELTRLQQAIAMSAMPNSLVDEDEPRLRYDILVSRTHLLDEGEFQRLLAHDATLKATIAQTKQAIADVAPLIDSVSKPDTANQALERLLPLTAKFISLAAAANRFGGEEVAKIQADLSNLYTLFSGLVAGLIVCGIALIVFLFRHNALLRQAHAFLRKATEELRETSVSRAFLDAALNNMSQGLCMFDAQQKLIVCNPQFSDVTGLAQGVARPGTNLQALIDIAERSDLPRAARLLRGQQARLEGGQSSVAVEVLSDETSISVAHEPMADGGWVATFEDVTERKRNEARLQHMAHHDALTGLPNRVRFREEIVTAIKHRRHDGDGAAVLCIDLDNFNKVNDTLGHPIGDALLRDVAERLRAGLRVKDTAARLGGDEFAIVQIAADQPMAADALAERLVKSLSAPYSIGGHQIVIGATIGIAHAPDGESVDPDFLMKNADLALYSAKASGRGTHKVFEPHMDTHAQYRRLLELDLRKALANDEFELAYQPYVNVASGRFAGCEALLRWRHPERGMVSPGEFIGLAEEMGLTDPIGEWVLMTACRDAVGWPEDVKVAVNVSPVQFKNKRLVPAVMRALNVSGLSPLRLEVEITESVLLLDTGETLSILHQLRALGVTIAMDDFGTGYSSLSYLKSFPFDKIKIDQSFVRDMLDREESLAIVRAVASLGKTLDMVTIAEGVETQAQLDQVAAEGCVEAQGYLISRPIPAAQAQALLSNAIGRISAAA
jgi:diguanylate cyclase (GGDEF)-like protein